MHAVFRRSTFRSQNVQNIPGSEHFWKLRCRKVHAVVARSTFRSHNVQNTPGSDHFWKLRCRKSARRCGWREAHFEVKMDKTPHVRASFGGSDVVSRGRRSTKACSSEVLGGQGADFLRGVAFWSIRSVGLLR